MTFDEVLETIRQDEAASRNVLSSFYHDGAEGRSIRHMRGRNTPRYKASLVEAARLVSRVYNGNLPVRVLQEAMTTSDFPILFGDILDRQMLGSYAETPQTYRQIAKISRVPDFRDVSRRAVDGGEGQLPEVKQQGEYPEESLSESEIKYHVKKYGKRMPFAWETMINDDLDSLKDIPQRFGRSARRSEEKFATGLYCGATGLNTTLYTVANKNIINAVNAKAPFTVVNPPLSIGALEQGLVVLANQVDADGEPITIEAAVLVVPPALEITARNILNATEVRTTIHGGDTNVEMRVNNWMRNRLSLVVAPYIPAIATTSGMNKAWFLFAAAQSNRAAIEVGFLRGHESPEIFMKAPNAVRVGGGSVDPMSGSFENDSIDYKIRHILGGTQIDPKMTAGSNGSGV